jgi:DNA-binding transcriptional LysR family regulator
VLSDIAIRDSLCEVELRQLRTFVAVAEEGSFTLAADRLHVVQSAVSATIRGLEAELGVRLFDRSTRRIELSDAGRALLPDARRTLSAAALAEDAVAQVGSGLSGTVALGTMQAQAMRAVSVPRLIAEFRVDHPGVEINVRHVGGSMQMIAEVREGRLDLAFVAVPHSIRAEVELTPLSSEAMVFVCAADHPLAGRRRVRLVDLAEEPFVDLPVDWGTNMASARAFAAADLQRRVAFEVNDTASVVAYVREGLGIALLPPSLVAGVPGVVAIPIVGDPAVFEASLATREEAEQTAATRALIATVLRLAG